MALLMGNFWLKNGSALWGSCQLNPNDTLQIEADFLFDINELTLPSGKLYKCEFKFVGPGTDPAGYSIFTELTGITNTASGFKSPVFPTPLPVGDYTILWITLYDQFGNIITQGKL